MSNTVERVGEVPNRPEVTEALDHIMDVFGGYSSTYMNLMATLKKAARESETDKNSRAEELFAAVLAFDALLNAVSPKRREE